MGSAKLDEGNPRIIARSAVTEAKSKVLLISKDSVLKLES